MNRKRAIIFAALFCAATLCACAPTSVTSGDKNFERAWNAFAFNQKDKADAYFAVAADNYMATTREDPPSRTTRFPSTRVKAGIAFYYAGKYSACIKSMETAVRRNSKVWEVALFSGLAYARMGDKKNAIVSLNAFLDSLSSERVLTAAVIPQLKGLEDGTIEPQAAADVIETAFHAQVTNNISLNRTPQSSGDLTEHCSGTYWWRQNRQPCTSRNLDMDD